MLNNQMQCSGGMSCGRLVCLFLIPGILIAALFATVGLIVGAVAAEAVFSNLAAFIVLAVVLALMLIIWIIYRACRCRRQ